MPNPRRIKPGMVFTSDELGRGAVLLDEPPPHRNPPPPETRGEPWGWTKGPPYPRGYREDGRYGAE
jgi:hypothetical protein